MIERHEFVENVVNRENDMEILDGQYPFLLIFKPLRLLKSPTLGTMSILSSLVMKFPFLALETCFQNPAHRGRAAIYNRAHGFRLRIRKPMGLFVCANMLSEDVSHIVFHP